MTWDPERSTLLDAEGSPVYYSQSPSNPWWNGNYDTPADHYMNDLSSWAYVVYPPGSGDDTNGLTQTICYKNPITGFITPISPEPSGEFSSYLGSDTDQSTVFLLTNQAGQPLLPNLAPIAPPITGNAIYYGGVALSGYLIDGTPIDLKYDPVGQ